MAVAEVAELRTWAFGYQEDGTPKTHLSPSAALTYYSCPECYWLRYYEHAPCPTSIHLPIGSGMAQSLCYARRSTRDTGSFQMATALEQGVRGFLRNLQVECPDEEPVQDGFIRMHQMVESGELAIDLGKQFSKVEDGVVLVQKLVSENATKIVEREKAVGWRKDGLETAINFDGHLPFHFKGYADAVLLDETINDDKTSRDGREPDIAIALQLCWYGLPRWQAELPFKLQVTQLVKSKPGVVKYYSLSPTDAQMVMARKTLLGIAEGIQRGDFPARPNFKCDYSHATPAWVSVA